MRYFADRRLVKHYISTIDGILDHFDARINELGLVGKFDEGSWPFVDWVKEWHGSTGLQSMGKTISSQWLKKRHKTDLVNQTSSPITMPWLNNVDAVLQCQFAGQEVAMRSLISLVVQSTFISALSLQV
jgi:hypothetical protein